jgi:hypothetical protein
VTAKAAAIPVLDPAAPATIKASRPPRPAPPRAYGTVAIETWPGFAGSIPTLDLRLDLKVAGAEGLPDRPVAVAPSPSGP